MSKQKKAVDNFKTMNCNQAVLSTFGSDFGIDEELSFALGLSFGGGMGKQGKTCGVVTGAYTVIGLWCSKQNEDKEQQRKLAVEKVKEFNNSFIKSEGSFECKSLLKYDMSIPEDLKKIQKLNLFETLCPKLVAQSTGILEKILH